MRKSPNEQAKEVLGIQPIFFKPNTEMVKWILEYANDRLIIDAGCGERFLLSQQLYRNGGKQIVCIDPQLNYEEMMFFRIKNPEVGVEGSFHALNGYMERYKSFIQMGKEILLIFARPCHSVWVEETLDWKDDKVEALYITVPENIELYDDLGKWKDKAVLLEHRGSSADNEAVYSIK